jgi:hypothetical protein
MCNYKNVSLVVQLIEIFFDREEFCNLYFSTFHFKWGQIFLNTFFHSIDVT